MSRLAALPFDRLLWLFPIAFTLHCLEELLTLPAWSQSKGSVLRPPVTTVPFGFAVALLTLLAWAATAWGVRSAPRSLAVHIACGAVGVVGLNVFVPHLAASTMTLGYTPGLATALLLDLPICSLILLRAVKQHWVTPKKLVLSTLVVGAATIAAIPLLFRIGGLLE